MGQVRAQIRYLVALFFAVSLQFPASPGAEAVEAAEHATTVFLNRLPYRLTQQSDTQYDRLLTHLFAGAPDTPVLKMAPLGRARKLFLADPSSCLFPTGTNLLETEDGSSRNIASQATDHVSLRLYMRAQEQPGRTLEDFEKSSVGYIARSGFMRNVDFSIEQMVAVSSDEQLLTMLDLGRLQAFLGHHPDTILAAKKLGKEDLIRPDPAVVGTTRTPIIFMCHNNAQGRDFIRRVNFEIVKAHATGRMRDILGPHADLPDPTPRT